MKDTPRIKSYHLDLSNFESSEADNCQYVLTSPRSLKACKKAGIKVCFFKKKKVNSNVR